MEKHGDHFLGSVLGFLRKCIISVLGFGPMPNHIAFIMDGNRRFAKNRNTRPGSGHSAGFTSLVSVLQYCYEMGIKYVTVYAFSIDNFKRKPDEVNSVMNLMQEKIDELLREESIVKKYGIRINFWGNLNLLSDPVRSAVAKAMASTARNTGPVLSVCVAYTSTHEIVSSARESFLDRGNGAGGMISVEDMDRHLYTRNCPDPDIVIRTSGETRLSNFLLWQSTYSHLQSPVALWPAFSFRHLVWAILEYQKVYPYLEKLRSSSGKRC